MVLLVAIVELNPLIVTLSMKFVIDGANSQYRLGIANSTTVPNSLAKVVIEKCVWYQQGLLGGGPPDVGGVGDAAVIDSGPSFPNRRRQPTRRVDGRRPRTHIRGPRLCGRVVAAGLGAILLSGIVKSPGATPGKDYLLRPVAAVVLGGAALSGGLASPWSTWMAAFFIQVLNQMLRILGLDNSSAERRFRSRHRSRDADLRRPHRRRHRPIVVARFSAKPDAGAESARLDQTTL